MRRLVESSGNVTSGAQARPTRIPGTPRHAGGLHETGTRSKISDAGLQSTAEETEGSGVAKATYRALRPDKIIETQPGARRWGWQTMRRNAGVYVRGRVWHPDHKTVVLDVWHRVVMNTEAQAPGRERVVFLD